jgi:two-component system phosphate regulon sensor histidine kinase PhoR
VLGLALDQVLVGLLVGIVLYAVILFLEMRQFYLWLEGKSSELPTHNHILIDIAETIHHIRRANKKTKTRLKAQLRRVEKSTSALDDGVVVLRDQDKLAWWNKAAEKLLDFQRDTDAGQPITNFIRTPEFIEFLNQASFSAPLLCEKPSQANEWLQFEVTQYGDNERLVVIRDVSRIVRLEQMRKDFVSNVSHELRTPLTVVTGYVETLTSINDTLPSPVVKSLHHIATQVDRMNEMVEDLSLLSRLDESDDILNASRVDLKSVSQQVIDQMRQISDGAHEINAELCDEAFVDGSERELYSALSNVAFNAIKYSPIGGEITVRLRDRGDSISFSVKDEGVGIDPKHIPRLTERFYRADASRATSIPGTGLGLAITKHVLIRHHGELRIQSWPGKGSKFKCTFPKAER